MENILVIKSYDRVTTDIKSYDRVIKIDSYNRVIKSYDRAIKIDKEV